ncbi:NAD-dependent protein deacetylase hst2-1 [Coniochaeta hoffmannii]|uniref:NAD-dependent protein deacetylase hst2-1 n=1 Tax=Coniochaeta hoffmannii TaxID=91930 RepID=A0AA38R4W4_9PEZI|nr:NAD-dependent protein deacetylase hst2-1 [Coniochaeta hoffmannii]
MGQENSVVSDDTPPNTLAERSLEAVADYIASGQCRRVLVMTGAGISTAAGIPDFRSPNTGLYANLARLNLPYAEAVFDISYFRQNPEPFYVLARELYPGHFSPTVSHAFIALLAAKGLLFHLFTQNIDCLEREAGVPGELIVEAHGSFATQRCIECGEPYPDDKMLEHVRAGEVPRCEGCGGLVKPDIVFFGEALPDAFRQKSHYPAQADMVLILGTSLTVHPFASLPETVREEAPRVLFNLERVGGIGSRADDVIVLGDCDAGIRKLADALGWRDELEAEWRRVVGDEEAERQLKGAKQREAALEDEVDRLAEEVEEVLNLEEKDSDADDEGHSSRGAPAQETTDAERPSSGPGESGKAEAEEHVDAGGTVGTDEKPASKEDNAGSSNPEPAQPSRGEVAGQDKTETSNLPEDIPRTEKLAEPASDTKLEDKKRDVIDLPEGRSQP